MGILLHILRGNETSLRIDAHTILANDASSHSDGHIDRFLQSHHRELYKIESSDVLVIIDLSEEDSMKVALERTFQ